MKPRARLHITLIGAGNVGLVLGRILVENGERVVCVISRTAKSASRAGRFLRCRRTSTDLAAIPSETDLIFIATPHSAVCDVVRALQRLTEFSFRGVAVCHASGMLTAEALEPLRQRGAMVFSFHPLQTFPRDFPPAAIVPTARGIVYGVDGPPGGIRMARRLARLLDGSVLLVPPEMREFYHAACVIASNHITTMLSLVEAMYATMTGSTRGFYPVFKPIVMATLRNIEATSPARALSGPVVRGGVETVARHFEALRQFAPQMIPYFGSMTLETVKLAEAKGSLSKAQADQMVMLIRDTLQSMVTTEKKP